MSDLNSPLEVQKRDALTRVADASVVSENKKTEAVAKVAVQERKHYLNLNAGNIAIILTVIGGLWNIGEKIGNYADAQKSAAVERVKHDTVVDETLKAHGEKLQDVSKQLDGIDANVKDLNTKFDRISR